LRAKSRSWLQIHTDPEARADPEFRNGPRTPARAGTVGKPTLKQSRISSGHHNRARVVVVNDLLASCRFRKLSLEALAREVGKFAAIGIRRRGMVIYALSCLSEFSGATAKNKRLWQLVRSTVLSRHRTSVLCARRPKKHHAQGRGRLRDRRRATDGRSRFARISTAARWSISLSEIRCLPGSTARGHRRARRIGSIPEVSRAIVMRCRAQDYRRLRSARSVTATGYQVLTGGNMLERSSREHHGDGQTIERDSSCGHCGPPCLSGLLRVTGNLQRTLRPKGRNARDAAVGLSTQKASKARAAWRGEIDPAD